MERHSHQHLLARSPVTVGQGRAHSGQQRISGRLETKAQILKKEFPSSHPQSAHRAQSFLLKLGTLVGLLPIRPQIPPTPHLAGLGKGYSAPYPVSTPLFSSLRRLFCRAGSWPIPKSSLWGEGAERAQSQLGALLWWCVHSRRNVSA